jgi:hypothetical protein
MANLTQIVNGSIIPSSLTDKITSDINFILLVLKAIGVLILIYIVFLIIRWIMDFIRNRRIKKIYEKVNDMDDKIDEIYVKMDGVEKKVVELSDKVFMLMDRTKVKSDKKDKKK